jgi:uncharacterized membrane protein YfhO
VLGGAPGGGGGGGGAAALEVDERARVVVRARAPQGGALVLADGWGAGWSAADDDGRALPVLAADVALRAVILPAGFDGRVTWSYRTPGQSAGLALSALGLAIVIFCWVLRFPLDAVRAHP